MKNYDLGIVGAGAAGLMTAAACSWAGMQVALFESADRIGKPILVTGNGRCNVGNAQVEPSVYNNPSFVKRAFACISPDQALDFMHFLGLEMVEESAGRLYPASNKAASVLDVLRFALLDAGVEVFTDTPIVRVKASAAARSSKDRTARAEGAAKVTGAVDAVTSPGHSSGFQLYSQSGVIARCKKLVFATGPHELGTLLPAHIRRHRFHPRLLALKTPTRYLKGMENVRLKALISLVESPGSQRVLYQEQGEVQFRDYGISGVCAFNLSRRAKVGSVVSLNLLPQYEPQDLQAELNRRNKLFRRRESKDRLAGLLLPVVAENVLKMAKVTPYGEWSPADINRLSYTLQHFELTVEGFGPVKQAQVHRGGVDLSEVEPDALELKALPACYVLGEALDIDADCGGFNLVWAWVSALICAQHVSGKSINQIMKEQL